MEGKLIFIDEVRNAEDVKILVEKSFSLLYPNRSFNYVVAVTFSGRFSPYNGQVSKWMGKLHFKLSKKWIGVKAEILQGLLEELLQKIVSGKVMTRTMNIDLYNNFIKNLHLAVPKTKNTPLLNASFERINEKYFQNTVERPNLKWGQASTRTLGHYCYKTDTITISTIFTEHPDCVDFIMYHELLHKVVKYTHNKTRSYHHTAEFRRRERAYKGFDAIEKKIETIASHAKRKRKPKTNSVLAKLNYFLR